MGTKNNFPSAAWWLDSWILKTPFIGICAKIASVLCLLTCLISVIPAYQFATRGSLLDAAITLGVAVFYATLSYLFYRFSRFIFCNRRP